MARSNYGAGVSGPAPVGGDPRRYAQYLASFGVQRDDIYAQLVSRFPVDTQPNVVYSPQWFGRLANAAFAYADPLRHADQYPDNTVIRGAVGIPADARHGGGYRYGVNVEVVQPGGGLTGRYVEIPSSKPLTAGEIRDLSADAVRTLYVLSGTDPQWRDRQSPAFTGGFQILFVDRP